MVATSKGLFAYEKLSAVTYSLTVRDQDGTGSGWAGGVANQLQGFNPSSMTDRAVDLAARR